MSLMIGDRHVASRPHVALGAAFRITDRQPSYTLISVVFGLHTNVCSPRGSRPSHGLSEVEPKSQYWRWYRYHNSSHGRASRTIRMALTIHSRTLEFTRRASGAHDWGCRARQEIAYGIQFSIFNNCQLSRPSLTPKLQGSGLKAPKPC
ncbi:hypothetical protein BKA82DRAFT_413963 [Pisolithus tinctorius]|uniref:Uncharacterized protein n=1 Tax=Pisolithus tinctorius Marx 270 TaxID=870435 RepID=A0A0C3MZ06_PISTI|nr:hypothetical protein BKA82DRAFT_413963 [Pisolithus tinctorius]KIN94134.1 hypothetical protein M404DRAFT_413963 [Pisolithus tinctorius Marx 270]